MGGFESATSGKPENSIWGSAPAGSSQPATRDSLSPTSQTGAVGPTAAADGTNLRALGGSFPLAHFCEDQPAAAPSTAAGSSAGTSLPGALRSKMERAFNFDFSGVRVHESGDAGSFGALAYARGSNLHFAPGQYDPSSQRGQELIGHELTHVVQQQDGRVSGKTQCKGLMANEDTDLEDQADEWGARAARGESVGRSGNGGAAGGEDASAPVQFFKEYRKSGQQDSKKQTHWANATPLRVAEDGTAAVAQRNIAGSQDLYVSGSRLPGINANLKNVHAPFQLVAAGGSVSGAAPGNLEGPQQSLERVKPVDVVAPKKDTTIPDDCGNAARTVTGTFAEGKHLHGAYTGKDGKPAVSSRIDPEMMKYEIMVNHFGDKIPDVKNVLTKVESSLASVTALGKSIEPYVDELKRLKGILEQAAEDTKTADQTLRALQAAYDAKVAKLNASSDPNKADQIKAAEAERDAKEKKLKEHLAAARKAYGEADRIWKAFLGQKIGGETLSQILGKYFAERGIMEHLIADIMGPYDAMTPKDQESFDERVGINRHANPDVGEAYTISSGGAAKDPNKKTWNFHWGGVIFKSTSGSDNITMENYAGSPETAWCFQMYGVPTKDDLRMGQTFHEQHRDVHQQHGMTPTTLSTEKH